MSMLADMIDAGLRSFEARPASPAVLRLATRLLNNTSGGLLTPARVREPQWLRLKRIVRYAYDRSPFYQRKFDELSLHPQLLRTPDDYTRFPFTTAQDLRDWQQFLAVPESQLSAVFTTSGTTGEPKRVYYTTRELSSLSNVGALGLRLRVPDRLVALIALPSGL